MTAMRIPVVEEPSLWFFSKSKVYDIDGQYIGTRAEYHSRFDDEHYSKCEPCYEDHLDFEDECRMDAMMDMQEFEDEC